MKLIARIDGCGVAFVGRFGVDDKWVMSGNRKPVTIVRNEYGEQNVSVEDIEHARSKHKIQNADIFFIDEEVQSFYNGE